MFTLLSNFTTMVYSLKKTIHFLKLITFALFMNAIHVLSTYWGPPLRYARSLSKVLQFQGVFKAITSSHVIFEGHL